MPVRQSADMKGRPNFCVQPVTAALEWYFAATCSDSVDAISYRSIEIKPLYTVCFLLEALQCVSQLG